MFIDCFVFENLTLTFAIGWTKLDLATFGYANSVTGRVYDCFLLGQL